MSLTLSYDTEPAAGIFCCFDCSRASLAMHTDAASLSDFVTLLQSACLCAFHTKNEQAHLWILIYVRMHIPQTSAARRRSLLSNSPNKRSPSPPVRLHRCHHIFQTDFGNPDVDKTQVNAQPCLGHAFGTLRAYSTNHRYGRA